jgi:hypothetical protein
MTQSARSPIHSMRGDRMLGLCEAETLAILGVCFLFFFSIRKGVLHREHRVFNHNLLLKTQRCH